MPFLSRSVSHPGPTAFIRNPVSRTSRASARWHPLPVLGIDRPRRAGSFHAHGRGQPDRFAHRAGVPLDADLAHRDVRHADAASGHEQVLDVAGVEAEVRHDERLRTAVPWPGSSRPWAGRPRQKRSGTSHSRAPSFPGPAPRAAARTGRWTGGSERGGHTRPARSWATVTPEILFSAARNSSAANVSAGAACGER